MSIQITFLGTSQAIPTAKKNHIAVLLKYKSENILIDCGEGTQRQFRKAKLNPCKLTKIFITHWHGDHVLGLPGLFQTLALNNYSKTLKIYIPRKTKHHLELMLKMFVFQGKIKTEIIEASGKFFENSDFYLEALPLEHNTPCNGYAFVEKEKIRIDKSKLKKLKISREEQIKLNDLAKGKNIKINNKLIKSKDFTYKQKGKKIAVILDTKINPNCEKLAKNADLLISESTYLKEEESLAKERGHLTAGQAAQIAKKSKVKKLILTHVSQRYENNERKVLEEAKKIFKNTFLSEDFMSVEV